MRVRSVSLGSSSNWGGTQGRFGVSTDSSLVPFCRGRTWIVTAPNPCQGHDTAGKPTKRS